MVTDISTSSIVLVLTPVQRRPESNVSVIQSVVSMEGPILTLIPAPQWCLFTRLYEDERNHKHGLIPSETMELVPVRQSVNRQSRGSLLQQCGALVAF